MMIGHDEGKATKAAMTFVVEHLDPELGPWSALEYRCIGQESYHAGARFLLTSVPSSLEIPPELSAVKGFEVKREDVESLFKEQKSRICLLDPAANKELSPADGESFDIFLFGGILGRMQN